MYLSKTGFFIKQSVLEIVIHRWRFYIYVLYFMHFSTKGCVGFNTLQGINYTQNVRNRWRSTPTARPHLWTCITLTSRPTPFVSHLLLWRSQSLSLSHPICLCYTTQSFDCLRLSLSHTQTHTGCRSHDSWPAPSAMLTYINTYVGRTVMRLYRMHQK